MIQVNFYTQIQTHEDWWTDLDTAQLTGTPDGRVVVPTYDWQTFLYEHTKKLVEIKSFHHLRFSSTHKRSVFARETSDGPEVE